MAYASPVISLIENANYDDLFDLTFQVDLFTRGEDMGAGIAATTYIFTASPSETFGNFMDAVIGAVYDRILDEEGDPHSDAKESFRDALMSIDASFHDAKRIILDDLELGMDSAAGVVNVWKQDFS